jgi:hypothetical protein
LSRERLGISGTEGPAAAAPDTISDEEARELARLRVIAKDSPDLLFARERLAKSLLASAASKGWVRVIEFLFSKGAKDPDGENSALVWAAAGGHRAAVEALLAHGSDINAVGGYADQAGTRWQTHAVDHCHPIRRKAVISVLLETAPTSISRIAPPYSAHPGGRPGGYGFVQRRSSPRVRIRISRRR